MRVIHHAGCGGAVTNRIMRVQGHESLQMVCERCEVFIRDARELQPRESGFVRDRRLTLWGRADRVVE